MIGRLLRHGPGRAGAMVVIAIVASAVLAPWISPFPRMAMGATDMGHRLQPPDATYWFGTDNLGRDILSRVLFGGRVSLVIGIMAVVFAASTGTAVGLSAGYFRGWVDEASMRLADLFLGLPALVLAMLVAFTLGQGLAVTIAAIAVPWWPSYARLVRSEVLRLRNAEFVDAAHGVGATDRRVMFRHILPNTVPLIVVQASLQMGQAILVAASLSFIGLGAKPPSAEWGLAVGIGREYIPDAWWISFFPGAAIMAVVIGFNLLGDGLRTALDPQAAGRATSYAR